MFSRIQRPADFACDAISFFWKGELEDQDEVRVVDLRHTAASAPASTTSCTASRAARAVAQRLVAKVQVARLRPTLSTSPAMNFTPGPVVSRAVAAPLPPRALK